MLSSIFIDGVSAKTMVLIRQRLMKYISVMKGNKSTGGDMKNRLEFSF